jgi:hypothetical protein
MNRIIETSKPFESFGAKAERFLADRYPAMLENIGGIHIGRNQDASPGTRGGYRITGAAQAGGQYLEVPDKILDISKIQNKEDAGRETFTTRVSDSAKQLILDAKRSLMESGVGEAEAEKRVRDSLSVIGHYDTATRKYVAEATVPGRVKDSLLSNLSMPYWDVSYTTKVFKQPFIQGLARNLVDVIGVPNIWADAIVMYAETFEGMARLSGVAKGNGEFNDSAVVRNKFGMLVSQFVNLVVDYETGFHESLVGSQPGNFLTPMGIGDRERYARLMLEQMTNALWLFGDAESGFDGLSQLANVDTWMGTTAETIWNDDTNVSKGASIVTSLQRMIGDAQEALSFLPSSVRINCSPTLYKALKWTMQSNVYSDKSPLQIFSSAFKDYEMIRSNGFGTGVGFGKNNGGIEELVLVSDPFCAPQTPWNAHNSDLMFITFPTLKSALDPQEGVIVAPVAIENFVLPSFPQRDGLQRTMLRRIGSVIAPIDGTIKIVRGFGVQ